TNLEAVRARIFGLSRLCVQPRGSRWVADAVCRTGEEWPVRKGLWTISMLLGGTLALLVAHSHSPAKTSHGGGPRRILYYVAPMHPSYRSDKPGIAPDCGMPLQPAYADEVGKALVASARRPTAKSVTIDPVAQQLFGIGVVTVQETTGTRTLRVPGRVAADESRVHRVSVSVDGFVGETYDDSVGRHVRKDQRLAAIHSQEFLS